MLILKNIEEFNLHDTVTCGQIFRYFEEEFVEGRPLVVNEEDKTVIINLFSLLLWQEEAF